MAAYPAIAGTPTPALPVSDLVATHGYVYVNEPQHIGDTTNQFLSNDLSTDLKVQPVSTQRRYVLESRKDEGTTAYGLWVPAGDYRILSWGTHDWGDYPTFHVEPGHITNLGSLVPVAIGSNQFVMLPVRRNDTPDRVADAVAQFRSKLAAAEPIDWSPQAVPKPMTMSAGTPVTMGVVSDLILEFDHQHNKPPLNDQLRSAASIDEFITLAKSAMPPLCTVPVADSRSALYFCAGFGQIRVRDPGGNWSHLDSGTWETTTAVAWDRSTIYAGFVDGAVRASDDDGVHWRAVSTFDDHNAVVSMIHASGHWILITEHGVKWNEPARRMVPDTLNVYMSKNDGFSDFSAIRTISLSGPATLSLWQGPTPQVYGDAYFLGTGKELLRMNLGSGEWRALPITTDFHGFAISPATGTITAYLAMGLFSKVVVSNDRGVTWTKRESPPLVIADVYFDDGAGQADRMNPGAFSVSLEHYGYDSAARRWVRNQELPAACSRFLHTQDRRERFCVTNGNSILHEGGGVWSAEFAVQ